MQRISNLIVLASLAVTAAACGSQPERLAYIERLGNDTMSVEVYSRTSEGFQGDLLIRSPRTQVAHYEASLSPEGTVQAMSVEWSTPAENPVDHPPFGFTVNVEGDSATVELRGGPREGTQRIGVPPGAIPTIGKTPVAFAVFEQAVRQAMASGAEEYPIHFVSAARGRIVPNAIIRLSDDMVSMDFFGNPIMARVGESGEVVERSGERTTLKVVGERVEDVDFEALAADFAARDARGEGMGIASPEATVEGTVGDANIQIVYSRPAKRGRDIWGGLVPYDEVWRTGANAATAFATDRDLEIGGALVPAGDYTLFSVYTPETAHLIINKQTGQWGTVYDPAQDLVRVELERKTLPHPLERFSISITYPGDGGLLVLAWDTTQFSVPIKAR